MDRYVNDRVAKARQFISGLGAAKAAHSGGSLLDHLQGTYHILQSWGLDDDICIAGLCHSVYGTLSYSQRMASLNAREQVRSIIGVQAERYVYLFSISNKASLFANLLPNNAYQLLDGGTGECIFIDEQTLRALLHIATANWIEQRSRLAVEPGGLEFLSLRRWLVKAARCAVEQQYTGKDMSLFIDDSDLLSLLSWDDVLGTERSVVKLDDAYLSVLASTLHDRLPQALWNELSSIKNGGFGRILRAPETSRFVWGVDAHSGPDALIEHITSSIALELWRNGAVTTLTQGMWSAAADVYLPVGSHSTVESKGSKFDPDAPFFSAQLEGGIVVDFDSPGASRTFVQNSFRPTPYGPPELLLPQEREDVLQKLQEAMVILRRGSIAAYRFVLGNLRTVIPRKQTNPELYPFGFNGSSTATFMGRAALNNAHYNSISAGQVAQSLLHEAIHIYLYKREFFNPTVLDWESANAGRQMSPWSGNTINHYAFAHAALVFFGLTTFFSKPEVATLAGEEVARNYVDFALSGFVSPHMNQALKSTEKTVTPVMHQVLQQLRVQLRKSFPNGPTKVAELRALDDVGSRGLGV